MEEKQVVKLIKADLKRMRDEFLDFGNNVHLVDTEYYSINIVIKKGE